jgi:large subunit ribosomal protein L32e
MAFLRRTWNRYSKLGKKRKKKQVWRRPTGRDNKMREKRRGYPTVVSIGYKKSRKEKKKQVLIRNISDLEKIKKGDVVIIGNIGKKKKIELIKKAKEKKIPLNINIEKFLKKNKEKKGKKKEEKPKEEKDANKDQELKKNESKEKKETS